MKSKDLGNLVSFPASAIRKIEFWGFIWGRGVFGEVPPNYVKILVR